MMRFSFLEVVITKLLKPSAITAGYVMTSAGISHCTIVGAETTCVNTKFLGNGDVYPLQYLSNSLNWCLIRDSSGNYAAATHITSGTTFTLELYVRYGWEGGV